MKLLEKGNADEASDQALAIRIGRILERVYPNHPWVVGFQGRGIVLRHLAIASEVHRVLGREGFSSLLPKDKLGTAKEVSKTTVKFAGELLEAFGLPRKGWDGRLPIVPRDLIKSLH
jgi:hypothetical protein